MLEGMTNRLRRSARALGQRAAFVVLAALLAVPPACAQEPGDSARGPVSGPPLAVTGTVMFHGHFPSRHVTARHVEVWLQSGYDEDDARYPVLYMHDGQNVFSPATAYGHVDWAVDETMTRLVAERAVRAAIVVAVWNTVARVQEYMPRRAALPDDPVPSGIPEVPPAPGPLRSDDYLRFLVEELKPFVDATYRTRPGPGDTFTMGSSMGGLISLYALTEYPEVFGGAAAVSTHWPAGDGAMIGYLRHALPPPGSHRIYLDHGTATLDSLYAPFQLRADDVMRAAGYTEGRDWVTRVFEGADHSERAWRVRVAEPLVFLLGPPETTAESR
jgi:predicted alpha/beta superfamily hydrolase